MYNYYNNINEGELYAKLNEIKKEIANEETKNNDERNDEKITQLYNQLIMKGLYLSLFK